MKSLPYLFVLMLLLNQCRPKGKDIRQPVPHWEGLPTSLVNEHSELLLRAEAFTRNRDSLAIELYQLIEFHFREEEEYVFPVLGVLPALSEGHIPPNADSIIGLARKYQSNAVKLLAEHQMITTLLEKYRLLSGDSSVDAFKKQLEQHALTEEQIYFPAVVLVAEYLKLR